MNWGILLKCLDSAKIMCSLNLAADIDSELVVLVRLHAYFIKIASQWGKNEWRISEECN